MGGRKGVEWGEGRGEGRGRNGEEKGRKEGREGGGGEETKEVIHNVSCMYMCVAS